MGDVTLILNKTTESGGGGGGDDEDNWNETSGSGEGEDNTTNYFSSIPQVKSSPRIPTSGRHNTDSQSNLLVYIVSSAVIFAVVAIVIVIVVVYCCKRRRKAQRARLASQGSEMKTMGLNKETRVFQNISGGSTHNRGNEDNDQMMSRFLPPPATLAPLPPTSSKARVAPEAEKLLKTNSGRSDSHQTEFRHLLSSEDPAAQHVYEEIPCAANPVRINGQEGANNDYETAIIIDDSQCSHNIKDTALNGQSRGKSTPVAKPRKSLDAIDAADENTEGYLDARMIGSAV